MTTNIMKKLTGVKSPEEKMAEAITSATAIGGDSLSGKLAGTFEEGGTAVANKIRAALGAAPISGGGTPGADPTAPVTTNKLPGGGTTTGAADPNNIGTDGKPLNNQGTGFSLMSYFFGRKNKVTTTGDGQTSSATRDGTGVFSGFISSFKSIFDENTKGGFLGGLANTFLEGGKGLGTIFTDLLGGLFGGMGGGGGGIMSLLTSFLPFRYGGIASYRYGGMSDRYSTGGIARGPQAGYPAMLHGNEAIVPLPSGGKIPVEMKGGGGMQTNNVGVTVNMSGDQGTSNVQGDPGQGEMLGKVISSAVQEELHRQRRPGGILSPYGAAGGI